MINYIKRDFNSVRNTLEGWCKRSIPTGIFLIYYIIVGVIAIPFYTLIPFIKLYFKWKVNRIIKQMGEA